MTTLSPRMLLKKWTTADRYHVQDYDDNWDLIDAAPGLFIAATSADKPTTWGAAQNGRRAVELDTGLVWRWTGSAWVRQNASGLLLRSTRTTDISTSATTLVTALTAAVTVPAGGRTLALTVEGSGVYNTIGVTRIALFRGATQLQSWLHQGRLAATYDAQPRPLAFTAFDTAPTAGAQSYTLQFSAEVGFGGTSTLQGGVNKPLALTVVEL